jgi:hypothetical protein
MATPLETYQTQYNTSQEHQNAQKWQNGTINDVASKYGFDFSQGYANQQAETAAAAQRNQYNAASRENQTANKQTVNQINSDLKQGVIGTENNFFQTYLQQRQSQANRGLNAGFQADQNLRLGMNQQAQLAGLYRDSANNKSKEMDRYNNQNQTISEALAQIEKQKAADSQKMYQDLLTQGYGMLGQERGWYNTLDQQRYGQYQDSIDNWYKEQDLLMKQQEAARAEAARQAAARASQQQAAARASQAAAAAKKLQDTVNNYNVAVSKQALTPIEQYVQTIAPVEKWRSTLSPTVSNMVKANSYSPANTPYINAYDKMKMLGL